MRCLIFLMLLVAKFAMASHFHFKSIIYDQTELTSEANDQAKIELLEAKKNLFYADELREIASIRDLATRYVDSLKIFVAFNNYPFYLLSLPFCLLSSSNIVQFIPCGLSLCAYSSAKLTEIKELELDEIEKREREILAIIAQGNPGHLEREYVVKKAFIDPSWQKKIEALLLGSYHKVFSARETKLLEDMIRFPCSKKKLPPNAEQFRELLRDLKVQLATQTKFNQPLCRSILVKLAKSNIETNAMPPRIWIAAGGKELIVQEAMAYIASLLSRYLYVYACKSADEHANQNIYESALLHQKVAERTLDPIIVIVNAEKLTRENKLKMLRPQTVHSDYFDLEVPVRYIALICIGTAKEENEKFECFAWEEK